MVNNGVELVIWNSPKRYGIAPAEYHLSPVVILFKLRCKWQTWNMPVDCDRWCLTAAHNTSNHTQWYLITDFVPASFIFFYTSRLSIFIWPKTIFYSWFCASHRFKTTKLNRNKAATKKRDNKTETKLFKLGSECFFCSNIINIYCSQNNIHISFGIYVSTFISNKFWFINRFSICIYTFEWIFCELIPSTRTMYEQEKCFPVHRFIHISADIFISRR